MPIEKKKKCFKALNLIKNTRIITSHTLKAQQYSAERVKEEFCHKKPKHQKSYRRGSTVRSHLLRESAVMRRRSSIEADSELGSTPRSIRHLTLRRSENLFRGGRGGSGNRASIGAGDMAFAPSFDSPPRPSCPS